jgi:putative membrane protein
MVKLDATDRAAVAKAVRAAEARTSAEIVPVVAIDSGRYDRAEDAFGFVVGLLTVALVWWIYPPAPEPGSWSGPPHAVELVALLAAMIVGTGLGTALAIRLPALRRLAIPPAQLQVEVETAARALFFDQRIHHTSQRDAVLIYVSLFERTVHVLPDQAVAAKLGADVLDRVCAAVTTKLHGNDVRGALVTGVEALGDALAEVLPADGEQLNELEDVLVVIE